MTIKYHISIILLLCCAPAFAGTFGVELNGLSYHYQRSLHLNGVNPGLGLSYESGPLRTNAHILSTAGYYYNSYKHSTFYALTGPVWHYKFLRYGVLFGAVSGYECDTGMHWTPVALPMLSVWRLNFTATPWFVAVSATVIRF